jgi:hypothetical protein
LVRAEAEWADSITTPRPLAAKSFGSEDAKETQTTLTTKKNASKLAWMTHICQGYIKSICVSNFDARTKVSFGFVLIFFIADFLQLMLNHLKSQSFTYNLCRNKTFA